MSARRAIPDSRIEIQRNAAKQHRKEGAPMSELTKTRTVLHRQRESADAVFTPNVEPTAFVYSVTLVRDVWEQMDRPDAITITIQPGDVLEAENTADYMRDHDTGSNFDDE